MKKTLEDIVSTMTEEERQILSKLSPRDPGNAVEIERGFEMLTRKGFLELTGETRDGEPVYRINDEYRESWIEYLSRLLRKGWAWIQRRIV
jgi:hypothetical protein